MVDATDTYFEGGGCGGKRERGKEVGFEPTCRRRAGDVHALLIHLKRKDVKKDLTTSGGDSAALKP